MNEQMKERITLRVLRASFLVAALFCGNAFAETTFDGELARQMDISYQPGAMNNVTGFVLNRSSQEVDVTIEFKGYTADGLVTQGNPQATIEHLGAGETARFQCAGFFGMVKKVSLIHVRTSAPS